MSDQAEAPAVEAPEAAVVDQGKDAPVEPAVEPPVAAEPAGEKDAGEQSPVLADDGTSQAPDAYSEFTAPEGVEMDAAALESAIPLFKEMNLTQEQSQKLVDLYAGMAQEGEQGREEAFTKLTQGWVSDLQNDKDFGGDNFEKNVGIAKAAVDAYGTPELKQLMLDPGVGNHPELVKFMHKVGLTLKEDVPGSSTAPTNPEMDRVTQLYGPQKSKT